MQELELHVIAQAVEENGRRDSPADQVGGIEIGKDRLEVQHLVEIPSHRGPGRQVVDGLLVLVAGALMLTPGFGTDALGLALLFPPSRIAVREVLIRRFARRVNLG